MKPIIIVATALLVAACSSLSSPMPGVARVSSGGHCLLEGSPCGATSQCCSQFCANSECETRDP
jgi:hypothetical protein